MLNDSCYKFVDSGSRENQSEAKLKCMNDSSHLVFIETKEENDFLIKEATTGTEYWIGVHEQPNLFWDDGNKVTLANMYSDDLTTLNDGTTCYRMSRKDERYLLGKDCSELSGYICEYEGTDCPSGYTKKLNNSCYKFVDSGLGATRFKARSECMRDSSHLVFIENNEENDFLVEEAEGNSQYWIGMNELPNLFWDDDSQVTFANIDPYNIYTFNDNTGCYRMSANKERYWLDTSCSKEYGYICEYEGADCPPGYTKMLRNSFYKFVDSGLGVNRSKARSECMRDSSHLVFIETKEENDFLVGEAESNSRYWIGIHERPNLFWYNGNQVTFFNIDPGKDYILDNGKGCYKMSDNDKRYWFDDDCSTGYGYICEYEG